VEQVTARNSLPVLKSPDTKISGNYLLFLVKRSGTELQFPVTERLFSFHKSLTFFSMMKLLCIFMDIDSANNLTVVRLAYLSALNNINGVKVKQKSLIEHMSDASRDLTIKHS
jgi:hypothetical protein